MLFFGILLILSVFVDRQFGNDAPQNETSPNEECKPGQFPSQVCVLYLKNRQLCGGSIIHIRHVLTSSYCFRDSPQRRNLTRKFVLAGDVTWGHVITHNSQARGITHLVQYPGSYREGFDLDDVAILKLNQSFNENYYVNAIQLSKEAPKIGTQCTLLGWSQPGLERKTTILRQGMVYIQHQIKCGGNLVEDTNRIICGANSDSSHSPCIVDPGGPLICNRKLAGVLSRTYDECDNRTYGSYFMNVAFYRKWIHMVIDWDGYGQDPQPRPNTQFTQLRYDRGTRLCILNIAHYLFTYLLRYIVEN